MVSIKIYFVLLYEAGETVIKTVNFVYVCFDSSVVFCFCFLLTMTEKRLCTSVFVTKQKQAY